MGRRPGIAKERKHIHLTEGRWDELTELYRPQGITPSFVIDQLVGFHLKRINEKINLKRGDVLKSAPTEADVEVEIDLEGATDE